MKKILLLSCCIPDELENEITTYCKFPHNIHDAANTFQKSLIHGFIENNADLEILSAPSLPAFPLGYKRVYIPKLQTRIEGKVLCDILPYFSFMIGKYASIERGIVKHVKEWIKLYPEDELSIVGYNINAAFMSAMKTIKSRYPKVQTALIVTDMIEDAYNFKSNTTFLKRIQVSLHKRKVYSSYQAIDKYILLSEQMKDRIPNCKDNYIVVEGIYTHCGDIPNIDRQKIVFYSGALDTFVNVVEMIEAFKKINRDDYKLVICGGGPLSNYVREEAEKKSNIVFLGSISRKEVLEWQRKSSILINPRQPSEITKYSFPSKTMEYFASGTPVLMYKLQGIPEEYYSYCYTIEGTSVDEFKECLRNVLSIEEQERTALGNKAKEFIITEKTSCLQVKRILKFLQN